LKQPASAALLALWLGAVSCRQIIGIERAEEDPSLSSRGGAKSAPSSGAAGGAAGETEREQGGAGNPSDGGDDAGGAAGDFARNLAGGEAGTGGEAGARSATLCESYCTAVTDNCTGIFAVYTSYAACLAVCGWLPEGAEGAHTGNSVQCRLRAALAAKDEVPHYCPIAGPGGDGVCGTNCESLCGLRAGVCASFSDGDVESCSSECSKLPDAGSYSTDLNVGQYAGPHVQCRLYHVSAAAAADNPEQHCSHVDGAAPCN
jgi:hypothetical protein